MKKVIVNKKLATLISVAAMAIAAGSTSICYCFTFNECKMPKSLYKVD